jgi:DNA-binding CsgD family transcriptional regulator
VANDADNALNKLEACEERLAGRRETRPFQPSMPGLLLVDDSLQPIYLNHEAVQILAYPEASRDGDSFDRHVKEKIRSAFTSDGSSLRAEFISGRRRYLCRKFPLASSSTASLQEGAVAILLERNKPQFDGSLIAAQFHLSQREKETMELLVHGFTSKEIAHRMHISPNTVKAFLRLIMVKMSVTTRSGLVARVFAGSL